METGRFPERPRLIRGGNMWKKDEEQGGQQSPLSTTSAPRVTSTSAGRATIGPSITIKGDVTGSEDLLIQGKIDGSVTLDLHAVAVGSEGHVKANISGRVITVEGHVEGDLIAKEQIILRGTAHVQGDIKAPRVVLEDGATFRGLVDMGSKPKESSESAKASTSAKATEKASDKAADKEEASDATDPNGPSRSSSSSSSTTTSGKARDTSGAAPSASA
jgi:cytoskeletal protein CcmA (bactofilin family)